VAFVAKMDGPVAEEVRREPLIARTSFDSRTTRLAFVVNQVESKTFIQILRFSLSVFFPVFAEIVIHSSITEAINFSPLISALNKTIPYL
jgi:hypothetical protein